MGATFVVVKEYVPGLVMMKKYVCMYINSKPKSFPDHTILYGETLKEII